MEVQEQPPLEPAGNSESPEQALKRVYEWFTAVVAIILLLCALLPIVLERAAPEYVGTVSALRISVCYLSGLLCLIQSRKVLRFGPHTRNRLVLARVVFGMGLACGVFRTFCVVIEIFMV